jgi:hypothetical protein
MDHDHATSDDLPTLRSLLRELSPRQRLGLAFAALIVLVGLGWKLAAQPTGGMVALPASEALSRQARLELIDRFRAAGLDDCRSSGDRLLVPRSQVERYTAVLSASSTGGSDTWAGEWERQNRQLTPFSSNRAREANREIARAKLITEMLQKLPDVQQADVVWDEDEHRGWQQTPKARATVYLMPRPNRVLTLEVIRSVRLAVAGSKKNLDPADVAVMDLARQVTYDGDLPVAVGEDLLPSLQSVAELCRREIAQQIAGLSEADVEVRVDLPRFFAFLAANPHEARQQLSAAAPGLLRVRVAVPAASGLAADEATRQMLHAQIGRLTGIGEGATADDARIELLFEQQVLAETSRPSPQFSLATWSLPQNSATRIAAGGGAALIGLILLVARLRGSQRRRSARRVPPAFHNLAGTAPESVVHQLTDLDDLTRLEAATLRVLYPHATPRRWAVALRGSSLAVREHLAAALSAADAHDLRQQCDALGPVTLADIEASRQRILDSIRTAREAHQSEPMIPL